MDSESLKLVLANSEDTPPEESAKNINRAKAFDISPDAYKDAKLDLDPKITADERVPVNIGSATLDFTRDSKERTNLVKEDLHQMSTFEKIIKSGVNKTWDIPNAIYRRDKIVAEKFDSETGEIDPSKEAELLDLNETIGTLSQQDFGLSSGKNLALDIVAGAAGIGRSYVENLDMVGAITFIPAAIGATTAGIFSKGNPRAIIAGARLGGGRGLSAAAAIVPFKDAYLKTKYSVYNDLNYETRQSLPLRLQGQAGADIETPAFAPTNFSQQRKQAIAVGVGLISGVTAFKAGQVLSNNNPFLRKFLNPKTSAKYIINNPKLMAAVDTVGGIFKSSALEGMEEGVQEFAETAANELGRIDGSEESFLNAMSNIASWNTAKNVAYSTVVGAGAGATFSAATSLPFQKQVIAEYEKVQRVSEEKRYVLENQNLMIEAHNQIKDTKLNTLAPEEGKSFVGKVLESVGLDTEGAWFSIEDLRKIADTPEKGEKIRTFLELNPKLIELAKETGSNVQLTKGEVFDIMNENPEITDVMRTSPDGQSAAEVRDEGRAFTENLTKAEQTRNKLFEQFGFVDTVDQANKEVFDASGKPEPKLFDEMELKQKQDKLTEKRDEIIKKGMNLSKNDGDKADSLEKQIQELDTQIAEIDGQRKDIKRLNKEALGELNESPYFEDEYDYLDDSIVERDGMLSSDPEKNKIEFEKLNSDRLEVKLAVAKSLKEEADLETDRLVNREAKALTNLDIQREIEEMSDDIDLLNKVTERKNVAGLRTQSEQRVLKTVESVSGTETDRSTRISELDVEIRKATSEQNKKVKELSKVSDFEVKEKLQNEIDELDANLLQLNTEKNDLKSASKEADRYIKNNKKEIAKASPYAIDPRYLDQYDPAVAQAYKDNERLQELGMFAVGGLDPNTAAQFLGIESGEVLLKKLANIPDKRTLDKRRQQRNIELRNQVEQGFKTERQENRDKAFSSKTKIHLREMDYMTKKMWTTLKRGIIKIAGKIPTVESLNRRAKDTISSMRIRDLNPKQFYDGERRTSRKALKNYLDGEVEQAFANKERAAYNSELHKEALNAKDKIEKFNSFWKKINTPSNIQLLKDAGIYKAIQEMMSAYKLDGSIPGEAEQETFNKWVKKQVANGEPVPMVPERLSNVQQSYKDLTVEQYQTITEMGEFMLHTAKRRNKILKQIEGRKAFETMEMLSAQIDSEAHNHPEFNLKRAEDEAKTSVDADFILNTKNSVKTAISVLNNVKNIILGMDQGKYGGFWYRTLLEPIVMSETAKRMENDLALKYSHDVIKKYLGDTKNFTNLVQTRVEIPEFKNFKELNGGTLRKIDLLKLTSYLGDPNALEQIGNYRDNSGGSLDVETLKKVIERETTVDEVRFAQHFFNNSFKRFEKAVFDLQKRTRGVDPEMVEGVPFTLHGVTFEGGYQPIFHKPLPDSVKIEKEISKLTEQGLLDESGFFAAQAASQMTKQDRLKERTGSQRPLDYKYENHFQAQEEIIHDIHYREATIDLLKILKQPTNTENIKGVIGSINYKLLLDSIKDTVSNAANKPDIVYGPQFAKIEAGLGFLKQLHAIEAIGFNFASAAMQWDSLIYAGLRTGEKTPIYFSAQAAKLTKNPNLYKEMLAYASEMLPDIKLEQDQIDSDFIKTNQDLLPSNNIYIKNFPKIGKAINMIYGVRKSAIDASFWMLREADRFNKVVAINGWSEQFLNGDFPGYSKEQVDAMSPTELKKTLKIVLKQAVDTTLTASSSLDKTAAEKNKIARLFVNYFTDRRARLLTLATKGLQIKSSFKRREYGKALNQIMYTTLITGISAAFIGAIRDEEDNAIDKIKKGDLGGIAIDMGKSPLKAFVGSIPGLDAVMYAIESSEKYGNGGKQVRPVSLPVMGVLTNAVSGYFALSRVLEDDIDYADLNAKDKKALITVGGYAMLGAPTNTVNKLINLFAESEFEPGSAQDTTTKDIIDELHQKINDYKEKFPEKEQFNKGLEDYQKTLPTSVDSNVKNIIPENIKEDLKVALSKGDWMKVDEETGAAGVYQFTEEAWNEWTDKRPDLGLTEDGRVSKNPKQQEKVMDAEIEENTKRFMAYDIPVTKANLLGAHEFGFDNFASIMDAKDSDKLKDISGEYFENPIFRDLKTVGQLKSYLQKKVNVNKD